MNEIEQDTIDVIAEMRGRGVSTTVIAKKLGVSRGKVAYVCLKHGIDPPGLEAKVLPQTAPGPSVVKRGKHLVRHFTPEEDQKLLEMREQGARICDIARALGRRNNSISGRLMTLARQEERKSLNI